MKYPMAVPTPPKNPHENAYDRLWKSHQVLDEHPGDDHPAMLYADLHLVHEGTYLQAFEMLDQAHLSVRRPDLTFATTDHYVATDPTLRGVPLEEMPYVIPGLIADCVRHSIKVFGPNDGNQGIVHVIGPELGLTQPGMTIVCGDSHTATHGALGALGIGVGTTQVGHVLATQCLLQTKQKCLSLQIAGQLSPAVTAKDLALSALSAHGVGLGRGSVIEFGGETVRRMSAESRMTLCNMAIEMGSRSGLISPDETVLEYLSGRPYAPTGAHWDHLVRRTSWVASSDDSRFDRVISMDATKVKPMVTYGTNPGMAVAIDETVPAYSSLQMDCSWAEYTHALDYMGLGAHEHIRGRRVDTVFIGSCTNARIEDLRAAASVLKGRSVAPNVTAYVVPGSQRVKRAAEAEGLAQIFVDSGARWLEPGCSMCLSANGDTAPPGRYILSTSNRNFENRQGPASRTILASPLTAAATAIEGRVADPRSYLLGPTTAGRK